MVLPIPKYNEIIELLKKGATIEAQEKIMELRETALQLQEESIEFKKKIKELEEAIETKNCIVWEAPYYFIEKDNKKDGPFCQLCYDKEKLLIRLHEGKKGSWSCHSCEKIFRDKSYVPSQRKTISKGPSWVKDY